MPHDDLETSLVCDTAVVAEGGVVKCQMLEDMDEDGAGDGMCLSCLLPLVAHVVSIAAGSVEEYFDEVQQVGAALCTVGSGGCTLCKHI